MASPSNFKRKKNIFLNYGMKATIVFFLGNVEFFLIF